MKRLRQSASAAFLFVVVAFAGDVPTWIEPCTNRESACVPADLDLARWALEAWQSASDGKLKFVEIKERPKALLRLVWAGQSDGLYGEAVPIMVDGKRGSQLNMRIADGGTKDALLRDTIVYLTCLHESGHALGLPHTAHFDDIMYSFQFGGDITEYFARYRRKLKTREDIRKNSGLSDADRARFTELLKRQ